MAVDIRSLELEFAKNPSLEACIPLCEAYLGNKRFMEAMVVCKKGIKNAPDDPRGRVLLARVYLDQGKLPKAEQELNNALQAFPGNPHGLELMGQLMMSQGRNQEAVHYLQQAAAADPGLQRAPQLLQQLGVAAPPPQAAPAGPPMGGAQGAPPPMPQGAPAQQMPPQQPFAAPGPGGGFAPPPGQQPPPPQPFGGATPAPTATSQGGAMPPAGNAAQPSWMQQAAAQPAAQQPAAAPEPAPAPPPPKLEHVSDFFAEETLGFQDDGDHIETAGPGRLTILGFVPKSTGSIKTTIFVSLALLAVASIFVLYQYISSENTKKINKLFGEMKLAMEDDKYIRYQDAIKRGHDILEIDDSHNLTLGAMAYAEAILADEHNVEGALERAKAYLQRAQESSDKATEYRAAATGLLALHEGRYEEGIAKLDAIMAEGGAATLMELEAFRLKNAAKPDDKETARQLQRLVQSVVKEARAYNHLGWYYFRQEDWTKADRNFDEAQKNSRDHPQALLGQALTDLARNIGLEERQKEIEGRIKKAHSLPEGELSAPVKALAYFARAQLRTWQKKEKEAEADFKKAFELDPKNAMFHFGRGRNLMNLGNYSEAIKSLSQAASIEPNNPRIYKKLGEAQVKAGEPKAAQASFKRAAELASNDVEIKFLDAERLRAEKDWDEAIARYQEVAESKNASSEMVVQAKLGISRVYRATNRASKAIKHMEDLLGNTPGGVQPPTKAEMWCELGEAYEDTRNKDKALQAYTFGMEQFPYYADCHYFMCRVMDRRDPAAQEACKRYLKVAPRGKYVAEAQRRIR